jgi:hypothetical protein
LHETLWFIYQDWISQEALFCQVLDAQTIQSPPATKEQTWWKQLPAIKGLDLTASVSAPASLSTTKTEDSNEPLVGRSGSEHENTSKNQGKAKQSKSKIRFRTDHCDRLMCN